MISSNNKQTHTTTTTMFSNLFNEYPSSEIEVNYKCPLMRLMSITVIPDDKTTRYVHLWIFERIDQICEAMGLPDHCLDTPLQRTVVAAILQEVYTPYAAYLLSSTDAYTGSWQRCSRYSATVYWDCLHKFLCANGGGAQFEGRVTINRFVNLVNQFIQDNAIWEHPVPPVQ